jgi:hypothetical protein
MAGPGYYVGSRLVYTSENRYLVVYQYTLSGSAYLEVSGTLCIDGQEYWVSLPGTVCSALQPETDRRGMRADFLRRSHSGNRREK